MLFWLVLATAHGYAVKTTPSGAVARWPSMPVPWALELDEAPDELGERALVDAVTAAFDTWEQIPEASIAFEGLGVAPTGDENVVRFEPDWSWDPELLAVTLTTMAVEDGRILAFETVMNGERSWGIGDGLDVQSVMAHELGHALGVDHSAYEGAVMFGLYDGDDPRRELHDDDLEAARFLYPTGAEGAPMACSAVGTGGAPLVTLVLSLLFMRRRTSGR